jgi:hypothetical protein
MGELFFLRVQNRIHVKTGSRAECGQMVKMLSQLQYQKNIFTEQKNNNLFAKRKIEWQ